MKEIEFISDDDDDEFADLPSEAEFRAGRIYDRAVDGIDDAMKWARNEALQIFDEYGRETIRHGVAKRLGEKAAVAVVLASLKSAAQLLEDERRLDDVGLNMDTFYLGRERDF